VNEVADRGPVACPGEAVVDAPGLQRLGGGPVARIDVAENFDRGAEPAGQPHQALPRILLAAAAIHGPTARRMSAERAMLTRTLLVTVRVEASPLWAVVTASGDVASIAATAMFSPRSAMVATAATTTSTHGIHCARGSPWRRQRCAATSVQKITVTPSRTGNAVSQRC